MSAPLPLLVVDGYNVIFGIERYRTLIDSDARAGELTDVASLSRDPYGADPLNRAREALIADVAAFAQKSHEAVIVFDGARNLSDERPQTKQAGVRVEFSRTGELADERIEALVSAARRAQRDVLLVSSDNTVRATVGGEPVASIHAATLARDIDDVRSDAELAQRDSQTSHLTLADRLDAKTRAQLDKLLGRG